MERCFITGPDGVHRMHLTKAVWSMTGGTRAIMTEFENAVEERSVEDELSILIEKLNHSITIQKISITDLSTDAIVNAANSGLWAGSGVCGAIFKAAGHEKLRMACDEIGHCDVGSAVITPGFNLKAKHIIHAVGPRWIDGEHREPQQLYSAYESSLRLAKENQCHSIGFPLISAGIFGYPLQDAWNIAVRACLDFIEKNADYDIRIVFAVLSDSILQEGRKQLASDLEERIYFLKGGLNAN